jgi:hypothetical protein
MPMVAWYVLSNESYMKRVINDVFPTVAVKLAFTLFIATSTSPKTTYHSARPKTPTYVPLAVPRTHPPRRKLT